MLTQNLEEPWD